MSNYHINPGDQITLGSPETPPPNEIQTFLVARGWLPVGCRFQHDTKRQYYFTWEQAVAFEFYEFITLGGK